MDDEEIDVVNYDPDTSRSSKIRSDAPLGCEECDYIGRNERGLNAHRRHKHQKPEPSQKSPRKPVARPRKAPREEEPERVTTKQLLGGRKRPKTVVENVDDPGSHRNQVIHGLEMVHQDMQVGEYVARRQTGAFQIDGEIDEMGGNMVVGEEIEIDGEVEVNDHEEIPMINKFIMKKYIPRNRNDDILPKSNYSPPKPKDLSRQQNLGRSVNLPKHTNLSLRLTHGDTNGQYKCYIAECEWRGNYRSLRMEHMKALHPEWKMPSRYLLQRISRDGVYIDPEDYVPPIACTVEGCDWRGNFRASRSAHMRKVHPEEHAESKKKLPGYNCNGTYTCHYPTCSWRGWSRSTRSAHIKKEHPEWRPDETRISLLLTCFHCKSSVASYPHLVTHIEQHGGMGLHVEQDFENSKEFSAWLERIETIYCIAFEKCDSVTQTGDFHGYTLHCNCVGGRGFQLSAESRHYIYHRYNFLKRRTQQFLTRCKTDCAAHLEVRVDPYNDRIFVKGSLEHCGHRFGTPLLRMSTMDRQLYADVLEWKNNRDFRLYAMDAVEKLNTYEGFTMDNFAPPKTLELIEPFDENQLVSIRMIIEQSDESSFFGINLEDLTEDSERVSFGYMSEEMKEFYTKFGPDRVVTIDVTVADFDALELFQYSVIVTDDGFVPKCVLFYVTTDQSTSFQTIIEQLKAIDPRAPREFLCDSSEIWVETIEKIYTDSAPMVLISEWTLMDYWATKTEQLIENEFDVFSIITALRRLLRCEDVAQFMFFVVEFFEALYECGYDRFSDFLDAQLSDVEYFKRWSPVHRNSFTSHAHPTLAVASRTLRDLYLSTDGIDRADRWFVHATKRIEDFNQVQTTQTFTLRPLDGPTKYFYQTLDMPAFHKQVTHQDAETVLVYEEEVEDFVEGDVVAEEVIGQMMYDDEVIVKTEPTPAPIKQELVDMEHMQTLEPMEQLEPIESMDQIRRMVPEETMEPLEPMMHSEDIPESEDHHVLQQPSTSSAAPRPHPRSQPQQLTGLPRILRTKKPGSPTPSPPASPPRARRRAPPQPRKRDTTKSVVRGARKKKDRFAELRDCPPEVMRAIAAHAIAYDGRKKEQQPFMYLPSMAQLAQTSTPVVPTPDYILNMNSRPFSSPPRKAPASNTNSRKYPQSQQWPTNARQKFVQQQQRREIAMIGRQHPSTSSAPSTSSSSLHRPYPNHHLNMHHDPQQHHRQLHPQHHSQHHSQLHPHHHDLHHEEEIVMEEDVDDLHQMHHHDDSQPCTSASLYR